MGSRDCETDAGTKKRCAKWVPACDQAIGRRLKDIDCAFPRTDENGSVGPKASVPKEKHEKSLNR